MRRVALISMLLCLTSTLSHAEIYRWVDENGNKHFSDNPDDVPKKNNAPNLNNAPRNGEVVDESPLTVSKIEIRQLLQDRKYQELNATLARHQKAVDRDIKNEMMLMNAYEAFSVADTAFESLLIEWGSAYKNDYQPHLASAFYFYHFGWHSRGGKWVDETSAEQLTEMRRYFAKAKDSLATVLSQRNDLTLPYYLLINMAMAEGNDGEKDKYRREALAYTPDSYLVRRVYMMSLSPRWGGSYDEMQAFAVESQANASRNPNLKVLRGYPYYAAGRDQMTGKNYGVALRLFSEALTFGQNAQFLSERSSAYLELDENDKALDDINLAISLEPENGELYLDRYWVHRKRDDDKNALKDVEKANLLNPHNPRITKQLAKMSDVLVYEGHESAKKKDKTAALENYNTAIDLNPTNADSYYRRARVYIDQYEYQTALADLIKAIELDPNFFESYLLIDWILARDKKWDDIISHWNDFLALNPDHGRAYLERGGAHYHKGDIKSATLDAKRSAELGYPDGKMMYERLRGRGY